MADLTPGELARIDQIHSAVMGKLAELISSAIDGIRTEGEAVTASALAGTAQGTDHASVSALLAAALIRCARYEMAAQKQAELRRLAENTPTGAAAEKSIAELLNRPEATP